jgi:hypothetical protein
MSININDFKNLIYTKKVGILIEGVGIGDKIQYTHLPENIYKNFGIKLYDPLKYWVFDKNPYIIRDEDPDIYLILDKLFDNSNYRESLYGKQYFSRASKHCDILDIKCHTRQFSLYDDEDQIINYNKITIHTGPGNSTAGEIPDYIIDFIKEKYKNFQIVQIGSDKDKNINALDKRGSSLEDMISEIRNSFIFIGVNSGPMNIANCYPNIFKKIIITKDNQDYPKSRIAYEDFLNKEFIPQRQYEKTENLYQENWLDFNCSYFNVTNEDLGTTLSYKRI